MAFPIDIDLLDNVGDFFNSVFGSFDDLDLPDEFANLLDDLGDIDLFDDLDDINLFDDINDLKLLTGLGDLFEGAFDTVGEFADSDFFRDLVGRDILSGDSDADRLLGQVSDDILLGALGNDLLSGFGGDDLLDGGRGRDLLKGLRGNDLLVGQVGNDLLEGGTGDDILNGGRGVDNLIGGRGRDLFVLEQGGLDRVRDFQNGQDRLSLVGDIDLDDLAFVSKGLGTLVTLGGSPLALLAGVAANQISAADFAPLDLG